ncbi:MAG: hypothetical protein IJ710_01130 [Prevotella sp.]|nr:hypothetical protein [Prevotella sp.]
MIQSSGILSLFTENRGIDARFPLLLIDFDFYKTISNHPKSSNYSPVVASAAVAAIAPIVFLFISRGCEAMLRGLGSEATEAAE